MTQTAQEVHGVPHRMALDCRCGSLLYEDQYGRMFCDQSGERVHFPPDTRNHNKKKST